MSIIELMPLICLLQDCKWKMYLELDGDEVALTYVRDVIFNANRPDVEVSKMTKVHSVYPYWL